MKMLCRKYSKVFLTLILSLTVLASGFIALTPYWSLLRLERSIKRKDANMLNAAIDFPMLRENLKKNVRGKEPKSPLQEKGFGEALIQASKFAIIDTYIVPEKTSELLNGDHNGIIKLMLGLDLSKQGQQTALPDLEVDKITYKSIQHYNVRLVADKQTAFNMTLARCGLLHWRITNIESVSNGDPINE